MPVKAITICVSPVTIDAWTMGYWIDGSYARPWIAHGDAFGFRNGRSASAGMRRQPLEFPSQLLKITWERKYERQ